MRFYICPHLQGLHGPSWGGDTHGTAGVLSEGVSWFHRPAHWEGHALWGPKIWAQKVGPTETSHRSSLLYPSFMVFLCKMGLLLMAWKQF